MTSPEQFLYSVVSIIIGGGIAITTQWVLAREKQKADEREKLREIRLEKYSRIWTWLCSYDEPSDNLETIHNRWMLSDKKYRELRNLVMNASPFLSAAMFQVLQELLDFWHSDLSAWRGSQQISEIRDRPYTKVEEYNRHIEKVFSVSQSEIKMLFNARK